MSPASLATAYLTKEDPSVLLLLVLAAHDFELDYERMSQLSQRISDYRQQSFPHELQASLYAFSKLARQLRDVCPSVFLKSLVSGEPYPKPLHIQGSGSIHARGVSSSMPKPTPRPASLLSPGLVSKKSTLLLPSSPSSSSFSRSRSNAEQVTSHQGRRSLIVRAGPSRQQRPQWTLQRQNHTHDYLSCHSNQNCRIGNCHLTVPDAVPVTSTTSAGSIAEFEYQHRAQVSRRFGRKKHQRIVLRTLDNRLGADDLESGYYSGSSSISGRVWVGDGPVPKINPAWACLSTWPLFPRRHKSESVGSVETVGGGVWIGD